jgi:hypothetical protein
MKQLLLVAVLALAAPACNVMDRATPEEVQTIEDLREENTPESNAEADALEKSIAERAVRGIVKFIDPLIPVPLEVFTPMVAMLAFKRVRRTTVKSIKTVASSVAHTAKGDWSQAGKALGDGVNDVLAIVGARDSRNDTADDLADWAEEVRVTDPTLAAAIDAKIAEMAATA